MNLATRFAFLLLCMCVRFLNYFLGFSPRCMKRQRGLAMRKVSVCPSVCLYVKRVDCGKTKERSVQIFIPHERSLSLVFREEEWLVEATPST